MPDQPLLPIVEVVIPTANRPAKLDRCLNALANARANLAFPVLVCDSSDDQRRNAVAATCRNYPFVTLRHHSGANVAAARNACARHATGDTLINVDDDIQVDATAIAQLYEHYRRSAKPCVVAGSVAWDGVYSTPVVMRSIGYGRPSTARECPSFLIGAFFAYSRELALVLPWNERIRTSDDRFMGALWRSHGVALEFEPFARATHDPEHVTYDVDEQASLVYANLFDALFANPDLRRALSYEFVGFAAGVRRHCHTWSGVRGFLSAWSRGNLQLARDRNYLRELVGTELPVTLYGHSDGHGR